MTDTNPLLSPFVPPHDLPPFPDIREGHYKPAIEAAIVQARANIEAIKTNPSPATFENTVEAMETASERLGIISGIFYNQLSAAGTDGLEALAERIGPLTSNFGSDITHDPEIFARVKAVHDQKETLSLTTEQKTLLEDTYKSFTRNGALLDEDGKTRLRAIDERLSVLAPQFANNVKKSMEAFEMVLSDPADLAGLPPSALAIAKAMAQQKGYAPDACLFTLDAPSYGPFITYSPRRELREKLWRAFASRAWGDEWDNSAVLKDIVTLKHERARLLGYPSTAAYILERRMAETPDTVMEFSNRMKAAYRPAAQKDLDALRKEASADGITDLQPWDVGYYAEKQKTRLYHFSSEDLRPYFPLGKVLEGTFAHFARLFNVRFERDESAPVWHKDVVAYTLTDATDGRHLGVLFADFYPRAGKKPGAWMTSYRGQGLYQGRITRPIAAIVCNFTPETPDHPSLLTHDEVETLFHEMGHAMHLLLAEGAYPSQTGTNVLWDFVELPSQVQENWTYEPETLALISGHYQTGENIPAELIEKLRNARNHLAGWAGLRQTAFGLLDMAWYTADPASIGDVAAFEDAVLKDVTLFPRLAGPVSVSFSHIFGGGYAAGYYSYKWAEVLDADTFELFLEKGLYDAETARRYRTEILAKGGSEPPSQLYRTFRGREADPGALLQREGLGPTKTSNT